MIHLHDRLLSWLGTGTALKGDVVKLCYQPQSPPISENDRHASGYSVRAPHNWISSVVVENTEYHSLSLYIIYLFFLKQELSWP